MDIKLAYGLRGGHIIHISEIKPAEKGEKCNCSCPLCGGVLVARLGDKRQRHFAHKASSNCDIAFAQQTGLHILAKEIILENSQILVPGLTITRHEIASGATDVFSAAEVDIDLPDITAMPVKYDAVEIEKPIDDIVADAVIRIGGTPCIVEVAVTHFVDEIKTKKLEALGLTVIRN